MSARELDTLIRAGINIALAEALQRLGASALYESVDGVPLISSIMIEACEENDPAGLEALLLAGLSPDFVLDRERGTTLLMRASCANANTVRILLDRGASPNLADREDWTALMYAVALDESSCDEIESKHIVKLLMGAGADPGKRNVRGHSASDVLSFQSVASGTEVESIASLLSSSLT